MPQDLQRPLSSSPQELDTAFGLHDACATVRARLHNYVAGDLRRRQPTEAAMIAHIEAHNVSCAQCARVEAQLRSMRLAMAAVGARSAVQSDTIAHQRVLALVRDVRAHRPHR